MRARWIVIVLAAAAVTLPALAHATTPLTATKVRIGNHGSYVRVVIDFNGTLASSEAEFRSLGLRMATARVNHPGVTTATRGGSGQGVSVHLQPATQGLQIAMSYAARRFKYLSYKVVTGNRLAIDLWKSTPPPSGDASGVGTCLSIDGTMGMSRPGSSYVEAFGSEHGVFEHTFQVVVRAANGTVLGRKTVTHRGSYDVKVPYHSSRKETGTVEAVAFSPKDGSVVCLAQQQTPIFAS